MGLGGLRLGTLAGAAAAFALTGCRSGSEPRPEPDRVLAGLRPKIVIGIGRRSGGPSPIECGSITSPGISIEVVAGGNIAWTRAFGTKEAGTSDSVTPETLFQAQSISKAVASSAMLRLVEAGTLSLDQDVNRLLRSWQVPPSPFTVREKVTLRRIVSHSAGFTVGGLPGYQLGDSVPTLRQILDGSRPANNPPIIVDTVPGSRWRYSGGGMTVMQQVMIDATNEPFPELMRHLVLDPAGMTRSTYQQPLPESRRREAAAGHDIEGAVIPGRWRIQSEMAAAGLWTTPTELAKWALDIAAAWAGRPAVLLSSAMAREMLRVQHAPSGLGVFVSDSGSALRFEHDGANRGFRAAFVMFPALGPGAVVMTNGDQGARLTAELFQAIGAEYGWPHAEPTVRAAAPIDSSALDGLVGDYLTPGPNYQPVAVSVRRIGLRLFFEVKGLLPREELFPTTADSFFTLQGSDVTFRRTGFGRADTIDLGSQIEATRPPNDSAGRRPELGRARAR